MAMPDQHNLSQGDSDIVKNIRYRAQTQQHGTKNENHIGFQQPQQQPYLSPELLRARWIELYKKMNKNNQV
ncbi:unnamed protein product [Adineta steineri]|uniref:Uncharacterized protein n=1 Tax=Adineta steineri TaxID=433720 RepID=A0A815FPV3_9BILA|nr:unnamed protein product [Adineta steineri]CAF3563020.1 unnamed protein product [Adineta steineri]CAF3563081.1 unnamed protein product [Adineta steineri]